MYIYFLLVPRTFNTKKKQISECSKYISIDCSLFTNVCIATGSAALAAIPVCRESGSTGFMSMQWSYIFTRCT